uniref:BTB domain-containing protein n=1 Tax=Talaromyces marneffei PM1 TaxID=1077442 RepID=A0A093XBI1_TALMA
MASYRDRLHFSKMFKVPTIQAIAGREGTVYHVHPHALSSCGSAAFKARIGEAWINGASEVIDWTDFDEQTIECFLCWLYTNDYDVRGAADTANGEHRRENNQKGTSDHDDHPTASTKTESLVPDTAMISESYEERPLTPLSRCILVGLPAETMQTAAATFAQTEFHDCDELLGDAVFMHAKIYCFAHRFLIPRLEVLALQRLTQVLLTNNTSRDPFFSRLADAIHLVYESTPKATQFDDPARKLLSQYVALNFTSIPTESLEMLVSAGGEFMVDVAQKLARRIATSGRSTESLEEHINELETKINALVLDGEKQRSLLEKSEKEIREWESWNRGISGKYKKARRLASPFGFDESLH